MDETQEKVETLAKAPRSDAQLQALARAREKAAVVRAQNAELRRTQTEADRLAAEEVKRQRLDRAERELKAMQEPPPKPNPEAEAEPEPEEEEEIVEYVKRKRPTKRRKVIVEEQSSDEEISIQLPKRREAPAPDDAYGSSYSKMFSL